MADLDRLVDSIDVDAALDQVVERHHRDTRRGRQQRVALVTVCAAMLVVVTWLVVRDPSSERSLDVAGPPTFTPGTSEAPSTETSLAAVPPVEGPATPICSTTTDRIDAARDALEFSPLMGAMDRSRPQSIRELLPAGQTADLGTVIAVRDFQDDVPPEAGWPTEAETGIRLAQAGVLLTVSTPGGVVEAPITLALSSTAGVEAMRPGLRTADLLALQGACVIVRYPSPGTDPGPYGPGILALAPDPTGPPVALDTNNDGVITGYGTPDEMLTALRGGP